MDILLVALLAFTQALDAWTTLVILKRGGRELNPIMRAAFAKIGMDATLLIKGVGVTLAGYWLVKAGALLALGALVAFYAGVIWFNWRSMPK